MENILTKGLINLARYVMAVIPLFSEDDIMCSVCCSMS